MTETVTVRRGGSYLTIPALAVDRYVAKGYDVVDDAGNVLQSGTPNDVTTLKIAYEKHVAEIARLKKEIEELKAQKKEIKPVEEFVAPVEEPPVEVKKSTSRRSKKSE